MLDFFNAWSDLLCHQSKILDGFWWILGKIWSLRNVIKSIMVVTGITRWTHIHFRPTGGGTALEYLIIPLPLRSSASFWNGSVTCFQIHSLAKATHVHSSTTCSWFHFSRHEANYLKSQRIHHLSCLSAADNKPIWMHAEEREESKVSGSL